MHATFTCCKKKKYLCVFTGNGHNGSGSREGSLLSDRVTQRDDTKIKRAKK